MVKLGSRPIGLAEAVLGEISFLRPHRMDNFSYPCADPRVDFWSAPSQPIEYVLTNQMHSNVPNLGSI